MCVPMCELVCACVHLVQTGLCVQVDACMFQCVCMYWCVCWYVCVYVCSVHITFVVRVEKMWVIMYNDSMIA